MTTDTPSTLANRSGDDWVDAVLRGDAAEHARVDLDDAGFTAKVMATLPPAVQPVPESEPVPEPFPGPVGGEAG